MGFKPDAAPAEPDHGDVWRESDPKRAQARVKRLQERIVQATEEGKWRARGAPPFASPTRCWLGRGTRPRLIPMLEPYAVKVARTVLRRGSCCEVGSLSDSR